MVRSSRKKEERPPRIFQGGPGLEKRGGGRRRKKKVPKIFTRQKNGKKNKGFALPFDFCKKKNGEHKEPNKPKKIAKKGSEERPPPEWVKR